MILKIGSGVFGYESYEIGVGDNNICYVRFAHCDWELASNISTKGV